MGPPVNPLVIGTTERRIFGIYELDLPRRGAVKPCAVPASVELFGTSVRAAREGEQSFTYDYTVNPDDLDRILKSVAAAKRDGARFVIAATHAHEALTDEAQPQNWQDPAAFLRPLAHRLIDAGADAFVATGIHHVAGIEVYKGKPIFYGIANFFFGDIQEPLPADLYESTVNGAYGFSIPRLLARSFGHPERITDWAWRVSQGGGPIRPYSRARV